MTTNAAEEMLSILDEKKREKDKLMNHMAERTMEKTRELRSAEKQVLVNMLNAAYEKGWRDAVDSSKLYNLVMERK